MAPWPPLLSLLILLLSSPTSPLSPPTTTTTTTTISPTQSPSSSPSPPSTPSSSSSSTLDPKQLRALQSLNVPTSTDPCSQPPSLHSATVCDAAKPFRHLLSLRLSNCSADLSLSITALSSLSSLTSFQFINCPTAPVRFPSSLSTNLRSFTCLNSLRKLTGVWLSRFPNLTDLTVSGVTINASGPSIILGNMKKLESLTISRANLTGFLPKHWHLNLTHIDLSANLLRGKIPSSLTLLENLQSLNLSSNGLNGEIPSSIGDLLSLQNVSLSSNSLSGSIPDSMAAIPGLVNLDLGSNQLNGTIPKFIADMRDLKYLNLEKNNFNGVMPFNASFIKRLVVFKIGSNINLCYNHSTISPKVKLGIAPCDKHGLPLSPPPSKDSGGGGGDSIGGNSPVDDYSLGDESNSKSKQHTHGPSKVVLGVAIGLSSVVFLIIFLVLISKCCR